MRGSGQLPTFVGVIQLENVRVLGVIRQLHHPAHDGDLFARCGFVLKESRRRAGVFPLHSQDQCIAASSCC